LTKSCIIIRPVADGAFHCGESFWVVLKTYHAAPRNSSFVQQRQSETLSHAEAARQALRSGHPRIELSHLTQIIKEHRFN
jgi:hypothetical protein